MLQRFLTATFLALATTLAVVHLVLPVQALRDRKTLLPVADSQVRSTEPDFNLGRAWGLEVRRNDEEALSFLMFDLAQLPAGTTVIEEATLGLFEAEETGTSNGTVNLNYCPNNDWTEDGITYNNKPAFQPDPIDTMNVTSNYRWYEWNVTNTAASTLRAADKRLSLALEGNTNGRSIVFYSRQSPAVDLRPELSVLYSYAPSSGIDPILIGSIAVITVGISGVGLELVYIRRKRRKQFTQKSEEKGQGEPKAQPQRCLSLSNETTCIQSMV